MIDESMIKDLLILAFQTIVNEELELELFLKSSWANFKLSKFE